MKALSVKGLSAAVLLGSVLHSGGVMAEWVVGASIGQANGSQSVDALDAQLAAAGLNATVTASDDTRDTTSAFFDYRDERWGARLAYVNLGSISATLNGTVLDVNTFVDSVSDIHPLSARGWEAAVMFRQPLEAGAVLLARAGYYRWRSEYDIGNASVTRSVSRDGTDPVYGLALEVPFDYELRGFVDWSRYGVADENVDVIGLGVGFSF